MADAENIVVLVGRKTDVETNHLAIEASYLL